MGKSPKKLRLAHHLCPGDSLVLSAAIRSLHLAYPGEYLVDLDCTARELYDHNPDVTKYAGHDIWGEVHYSDINQSNEVPISFLAAMCNGVAKIIGRPVPLKTNRPVLVLSDEERQWSGVLTEIADQPTPFGIICSGFKRDFPTKGFGPIIGQEVVDRTADRIKWVQIGTSNEVHQKLNGVVDLIDRTSIRDLIRVAYWSEFAVGPVTLLMWVCAALQKPYVGMLGGREPRSWTTTPNLIEISAHGWLPCCREKSCWRSRVVPLGDGTPADNSLCSLPVLMSDGSHVPKCHVATGADAIVTAVDRLKGGG